MKKASEIFGYLAIVATVIFMGLKSASSSHGDIVIIHANPFWSMLVTAALLFIIFIAGYFAGEHDLKKKLLKGVDKKVLERFRRVEAVIKITAFFQDGEIVSFKNEEEKTETKEYEPPPLG